MKKTLVIWSAMLVLAGCGSVDRSRNLANPEVNGQTIARQVCSTCHGLTGNSVSPEYPKLAAQQPEYLIAQIEKFKDQVRTDRLAQEIMAGMVRHLTDRQKSELAIYFSRQTNPSQPVENDQLLAQGMALYRNGDPAQNTLACVQCHGANAEGLGAIPRLAGQHVAYLSKELKVFRDQHGREGTPMTDTARRLSDQDINALAAYLSSL
jgi:cytochrome c553